MKVEAGQIQAVIVSHYAFLQYKLYHLKHINPL